jgi:hypothetical protein
MKKIVLPLILIFSLVSATIAFAAGSLTLPNYPVNFSYSNWGSSTTGGMYDTHLSGIGAGFDVADGTYAGWCVQKDKFSDPLQVLLYSSDDPAMPADAVSLPWDKVNYLLNHKAGTAFEIQEALWIVLGQENLADASTPAIAAMASDALANGGGFAPAAGQIIAVLLYSDGFGTSFDQMQETIIELTVPSRGPGTGTPGYWKNHPEAWPVDSITIGEDTYTKAQAIKLMGKSDGDKTYTMFRAYVSAYLNVLIGNESSCIDDTLADAYNWLDKHEPGSGVTGSSKAWKVGEPLYLTLDAYNNGLLCAPHRN